MSKETRHKVGDWMLCPGTPWHTITHIEPDIGGTWLFSACRKLCILDEGQFINTFRPTERQAAPTGISLCQKCVQALEAHQRFLDGIEIIQVERITHTEAMPLIAAGWAEYEAGPYGERTTLVNWDDHCLYAKADGRVISVLAWRIIDWKKSAYIVFGYTTPEWRKHGIYTRLFNRLVEVATEKKLNMIESGVHKDNIAMQKAAESQGREAVSITYRYMLPQAEDQNADTALRVPTE